MSTDTRPSVLFVCTHNAARSQMAEGLLRSRYGDRFQAASAGTEPGEVHPLAVEAMGEIGVDISAHASMHVDDVTEQRTFDIVVTVCDRARESCPYVPARDRTLHRDFGDPSAAKGPRNRRLEVFRQIRDEISEWIDQTFGET